MAIPVESFILHPQQSGTLQARLQQTIAQGILSGQFRKGEKLPSTRKLASHLGISRITVTLAYTELLASDYLMSKDRSGYYVSDTAPETPPFEAKTQVPDRVDWGRAINALTSDHFDRDDPMLLEFIARHTLPRRGIFAQEDQILVTLGAQNALWLASQVLLTQRRTAVIENPCYPALLEILNQSRCHIHPVDVDARGMVPDEVPDNASVIFTTPSHQCPTNHTMPLDRRKALLDRAANLDTLIVEDDYEFEIANTTTPSPALKSLDADGRVIYVGSFSKSLFPGLRLGYLVGSAPFIREARALRASVLRHPPGHIQRTAAYFLSLGYYDSQIKRTARTYRVRRETLINAIEKYNLTIDGPAPSGGSSVWMKAPDHVDTADLAQRLQNRSVLIEPGTAFFPSEAPSASHYRLAYSSIGQEHIETGISLIADEIARTGLVS
ncbi:MAG: PLP-dependent aminotransferase family protein [Rhodobacteraceae bacterium]|nr:PLP-dependent aminotransferase family protein [Paracoccaceae bacterium]